MKKNNIVMIALACLAVSCSTKGLDEERPVEGTKIIIPVQDPGTKAVDAEGKATFEASENVYVAKSGVIDSGVLHPTEDAASTAFEGTLAGSYATGDHISVLYNANASGVVDYSNQDGAIEGVKDGGWAEDVEIVSLEAGVLTTESAKLQNLQSIFKFTFINASTSAEINGVRFVRIYSNSNKLVAAYDVLTPANSIYGQVVVSRSTDLPDNYVYAALRFDANPSDEIHFEVIDNAGTIYQGSKTAPAAGFANGKFYTSTVTVTPIAPGTPYSNIATLKYAINAPLATLSELKSTYECKYIDKDGNISNTKGANEVGIIAYLNNTNIVWNAASGTQDNANFLASQSSISFSGMRLLVLALETNDSLSSTWNTLSSNGFTYNVQKPAGSTMWFVPSYYQCTLMGFPNPGPADRTGAAAIVTIPNQPTTTKWVLSSSHNILQTQARSFRTPARKWSNVSQDATHYYLPCFAY